MNCDSFCHSQLCVVCHRQLRAMIVVNCLPCHRELRVIVVVMYNSVI